MERAIYRIIDANFNRAREAIRVMEEFTRFALNSSSLTEQTRQLRHKLSSCIGKLDARLLITSRDTPGDVGIGSSVESQLIRENLNDCFTAGCKRLHEALRALSEVVGVINRPLAGEIEALRYASYTLEKEIVLFGETSSKFGKVSLYIVITNNSPAEIIKLTHNCVSSGADCIQLRAKAVEDDRLFSVAVEFVQICREAGVISIINDRSDVAVAAGADGVHLGQNDLPVEQARRIQLSPLIIGKSTHSIEQLKAACSENPTYVGLGPVFATATKPCATAVGLDYVKQATEILCDTGIGHVAIGGINLDNVRQVLEAGASCIAVCAAVTQAGDPAAACRALKAKISTLSD